MAVELSLPPLGLYVHLPWCVSKCPYCDFNSHALKSSLPASDYVDHLLSDVETELPRVWGRPVSSIYLGGGTPSLFPAADLARLLQGLRARLTVMPAAEITLEANPGTVERDSFAAYREAGFNRVSLGAQSFDDTCLKALGRIHGAEDIHRSLGSLSRAGFDNFNIDLMYGLPGQSAAMALEDLALAIEAKPAHLSHYQLTLEPNTAFAQSPPTLPGETVCWDMQASAANRLESAGYRQYEVSAWSQPTKESRHNMNYWRFGDYLGIGAGAHGKLTMPATRELLRTAKHRHPRQYMSGSYLAQERTIGEKDRIFEYFLNAFRLREGFYLDHFTAGTGVAAGVVESRLQEACDQGLLEPIEGGFRPSSLGWRFSNDLQALFLPESDH